VILRVTTADIKFTINGDIIITIAGPVSCTRFETVTVTNEFSTLSSHSSSLKNQLRPHCTKVPLKYIRFNEFEKLLLRSFYAPVRSKFLLQ
jgi:hypothetical protein